VGLKNGDHVLFTERAGVVWSLSTGKKELTFLRDRFFGLEFG